MLSEPPKPKPKPTTGVGGGTASDQTIMGGGPLASSNDHHGGGAAGLRPDHHGGRPLASRPYHHGGGAVWPRIIYIYIYIYIIYIYLSEYIYIYIYIYICRGVTRPPPWYGPPSPWSISGSQAPPLHTPPPRGRSPRAPPCRKFVGNVFLWLEKYYICNVFREFFRSSSSSRKLPEPEKVKGV